MTKTSIVTTVFLAAAIVTIAPRPAAAHPMPIGIASDLDDRADDLYDKARDLIEEGRYDRAVGELDRLIALNSNRTDAALYWKAYCQMRLGQRAEALTSITDLTKRFTDSRWLRDAKALEVEVRQSSGQTVSPSSQDDDRSEERRV